MKLKIVIFYLVAILFALFLVMLGDLVVLERTPHAPREDFRIRGDTHYYTAMIEGDFTDAPPPFRYRVLVPFLGNLLPFSPLRDLKALSYGSLFLFYLLVLFLCRKTGGNYFSLFMAMCAVYATRVHLYNYHNPFLVDAFGLLSLSILMAALLTGAFFTFCLFTVMGILARESTLFFVPTWLGAHKWKKGVIVIVLALVAFMIPRILLFPSPEVQSSILKNFHQVDRLHDLSPFFKSIILTWDYIWLLSILGVILLPPKYFRPVALSYILLFIGALLSCFFATDVRRMFAILSPVMILGCSRLFRLLGQKSAFTAVLFLMIFSTRLLTVIPNLINPDINEIPGARVLSRSLVLAGFVLVVFSVYLLRSQLKVEIRGKIGLFKSLVNRGKSNVPIPEVEDDSI